MAERIRSATGTSARALATVEALREVVAEAGLSLTSAVLAWVLAKPAITAPIIGASRPEQLQESRKATERKLDPALARKLDELTDYRRGDAERWRQAAMAWRASQCALTRRAVRSALCSSRSALEARASAG